MPRVLDMQIFICRKKEPDITITETDISELTARF